MKKLLATLLVVAMLALNIVALASCRTKPLTEFEVPSVGYDGSKVTIEFSHTMGSDLRAVLDEAIERFNEIYPNIEIKHEQTGGYDDVRDVTKNKISVGAQPDIVYCYPDHVALYNLSKVTVDLYKLINSDIQVSGSNGHTEKLGLTEDQIADFIEGYYQEGTAFEDGTAMYTLPFSKSTELLYYNKTFFEKHNLQLPKTWDEMDALLKEIKRIDPNCTPLGYDSEANWFITMCEQLGSDYTSSTKGQNFLFDNDLNHAFAAKFREWYQAGLLTTQELNGGKYSSTLFVNQTAYMSIGSSAGADKQRPAKDSATGEYPFEMGITSIPQGGLTLTVNGETKTYNVNTAVISQGPSVCLLNQKNPQEVVASWLFIKFLTTDVEFQADFSKQSGYVPVIKSVTEDADYAKFLSESTKVHTLFETKAETEYSIDDNGYLVGNVDGTNYWFGIDNNLVDPTTDDKANRLFLVDEAFPEVKITASTFKTNAKYLIAAEVNGAFRYMKVNLNKDKLVETTASTAQALLVSAELVTGKNGVFNLSYVEANNPQITTDDKVKHINMNTYTNDYITAIAAQACLDQEDYYFTSPAFNGSSTARDQVGALLQACLAQTPQNGETVEQMIERLFDVALKTCTYRHRQD